MYGPFVVAYLFLGGAAGGTFFVASLWSLLFHAGLGYRSCPADVRRAFKLLLRCAYTLGSVALAVGLLCLLGDMLFPERALLLFTRPHFTILTFGGYALLAQLAVGVALAAANLFDLGAVGGRARRVLEVACVGLSVFVMAYTGMFLYSNVGVELWHTVWIVALFLLSALSSGIAVVMLCGYFIPDQMVLLQGVRPLQAGHIACLVLEAAALACFAGSALLGPRHGALAGPLSDPANLHMAVVGVVGLGIVVPLCAEVYALFRKECRIIPVSDAVCLIGAFLLRYCVIAFGAL